MVEMLFSIHSFRGRKTNPDATSNSLRWPSCKGLNEPGKITFLLKFFSSGATSNKNGMVQKIIVEKLVPTKQRTY